MPWEQGAVRSNRIAPTIIFPMIKANQSTILIGLFIWCGSIISLFAEHKNSAADLLPLNTENTSCYNSRSP